MVDRENLRSDITHWRCVKNNCRGALKTNYSPSNILSVMNHTHPPNPDDNLVRNVRNNMRTLAVISTSRPRQIISQFLRDADESVSARLPPFNSLQRNVQWQRKAASFPFPLPYNASDLVIPEELKISYRGERFLLFDIFDVNVGRVLIYNTDRQKALLEHSRSVYFDGTFKTVPSIFLQLFAIYIEYKNAILLSAFILLQRKTTECYNRVWNILTTNLDLNFSSSMSDFESASINSFKEHFPNCRTSGCFFHFTQNIWRKIQSCGLSTDSINNGKTSLYLKMLPALAFCKPTRVVSYYERLEDYLNNLQIIPILRQILTYFEDTYIGRFHRTERSPPLYAVDFWNQYQRCLNEQPRANNSVEGSHNAFSSLADAPKQNIYSFLHLLKEEMAIVDNKINTLEMNPAVTLSERANFSNERLRTLVARFNELDPIEYLRSIALLLNF